MRKLVRRRPSPAMFVAIVGLIVASSGNAVADGVKAVASVVGKNQVTTTSVKDNSLLLKDFRRSERAKLKGPPGRAGAPGPKGDPGTPALDRVISRTAPFSVPTATAGPFAPRTTGNVSCDAGQVAVGGGARPDDNNTNTVIESYPVAGRGWAATVANTDTTRPHEFTVFVLCVAGSVG